MLRNVYLEGELGQKFLPHMQLSFTKPAEIFQALDANYPEYKSYMMEQHEKGVGYHIDVAGNELEHDVELLLEMKEGDVIVTPVPAGSKSGPLKILAAVALIVVTAGAAAAAAGGIVSGTTAAGATGFAAAGTSGAAALTGTTTVGAFSSAGAFGAALTAANANILGQIAIGFATQLAIAGIQQMMAPDPSSDGDQEESYLYNGSEQNIVSGDPVPILYGRLRVPGQMISFETQNTNGRSGISYQGGEAGSGYGYGSGDFYNPYPFWEGDPIPYVPIDFIDE